MEAGKVITGYSLPYVAIYTVTEGVVALTSALSAGIASWSIKPAPPCGRPSCPYES